MSSYFSSAPAKVDSHSLEVAFRFMICNSKRDWTVKTTRSLQIIKKNSKEHFYQHTGQASMILHIEKKFLEKTNQLV